MQMRAVAEKAIRLDPTLERSAPGAGDGLRARRAMDAFGKKLPLGRIEEGVHEMKIAEKADPLSPWVQSSLAGALLPAGRYEAAAAFKRSWT